MLLRSFTLFVMSSIFITAVTFSHGKENSLGCSASNNVGLPENGCEANLPLPSSMPIQDYERVLYRFLMERDYQKLNWRKDKEVRDTGPFINTQYYGTHPAVRIHYSPEVISWLENGRQGELPDGSMIIKEMYVPPASLYQEMANNPKYQEPAQYEQFLDDMVNAWTVMVKDTKASADGWFWANPGIPQQGESIKKAIERQLDTLAGPPASEFGAPCLRCHASAENEFTFSSLKNIEGFLPKETPLRFFVDTSWRTKAHFTNERNYPITTLADDPYVQAHFILPEPLRPYHQTVSNNTDLNNQHSTVESNKLANSEALPKPNPEFVSTFKTIKPMAEKKVLKFPSQWTDQVLPASHKTQEYITSDNCFGCHGGLGGEPYGVTMFLKTGPNYGDGINVSEYGEWRWSPMGLAGRDPIFHAQLESEMVLLERDAKMTPSPLLASLQDTKNAVTNTCLSCHGAMGERQLQIDAAKDPSLNANFSTDYFYLTPQLSNKNKASKDKVSSHQDYLKYGQLAREGVSCAICHHIDAPSEEAVENWNPPKSWLTDHSKKGLAYQLFHNNTGRFVRGPANEFFGPFKDVAQIPMQQTLGVTPVHNEFIQESKMCGTCHTINLPNIGATKEEYPVLNEATTEAFKGYQHSIEQATFLEWQNSVFADPNSQRFQSCQDCHMPGGYESLDGKIKVDQITTQIAAIQDINYPEAEHRLSNEELDIPLRDNYKRHEHVGLNVFLLEMFDQFPQILGVDKNDYMTSATNGVDIAIENMIRQAQQATVSVNIDGAKIKGSHLKAKVSLRNLTGHRFPSGVAFRRAFIEFAVLEGNKEIWVSGRTNDVGVILNGQGEPLATEFLPNKDTYQPHHQIITSEDQVQIYEELNQNAAHEFTTSFVHRVHDIKDNRLLPDGWRDSSFFRKDGKVLYEFMEATDPKGVADDPDYVDNGKSFEGGDSILYDIKLPEGINLKDIQVRATVYSQSIPPSWLHQRFSTAPNGEATKRLYYMASHLDLSGTPMQHWKLKLVSATRKVK